MRPLLVWLGISLAVSADDALPLPHYGPCSMDQQQALIGYPLRTTNDGRVTIKVESWVHGSGGDTVFVRPSYCAFLPGQRLLVYVACWDSNCSCSGTKLADLAREELVEFETLRTGRNIVRGNVYTVSRSEAPKPHAGAVVELEAGRQVVRAVSAGRRQLRDGLRCRPAPIATWRSTRAIDGPSRDLTRRWCPRPAAPFCRPLNWSATACGSGAYEALDLTLDVAARVADRLTSWIE